MIVIGIFVITAGVLMILKRTPISRQYVKQYEKFYGKAGRLAVQAGMASPGFIGLTGVGFTLIGAVQILVGIVSIL
ncbi:hypothetical protein [Herbiconiux daphne]|uniref:DUF3784 domain-containing protein n=1 Tax=Herbiconiux daphne TaxID=2970914 RepID=A0ABT2GWH4_9MICO|nr:hypothetical protein [Herbiconiux daphne]MCS5732305.1 hypothetical protein [Herbiconiux daphne]